jgi:hypothetical protein
MGTAMLIVYLNLRQSASPLLDLIRALRFHQGTSCSAQMNAKWHLACYRSKLLKRFWQNRRADGSRQPTANELQGARYQGRRIAEVAHKLHG